jgi:hypothetical protein
MLPSEDGYPIDIFPLLISNSNNELTDFLIFSGEYGLRSPCLEDNTCEDSSLVCFDEDGICLDPEEIPFDGGEGDGDACKTVGTEISEVYDVDGNGEVCDDSDLVLLYRDLNLPSEISIFPDDYVSASGAVRITETDVQNYIDSLTDCYLDVDGSSFYDTVDISYLTRYVRGNSPLNDGSFTEQRSDLEIINFLKNPSAICNPCKTVGTEIYYVYDIDGDGEVCQEDVNFMARYLVTATTKGNVSEILQSDSVGVGASRTTGQEMADYMDAMGDCFYDIDSVSGVTANDIISLSNYIRGTDNSNEDFLKDPESVCDGGINYVTPGALLLDVTGDDEITYVDLGLIGKYLTTQDYSSYPQDIQNSLEIIESRISEIVFLSEFDIDENGVKGDVYGNNQVIELTILYQILPSGYPSYGAGKDITNFLTNELKNERPDLENNKAIIWTNANRLLGLNFTETNSPTPQNPEGKCNGLQGRSAVDPETRIRLNDVERTLSKRGGNIDSETVNFGEQDYVVTFTEIEGEDDEINLSVSVGGVSISSPLGIGEYSALGDGTNIFVTNITTTGNNKEVKLTFNKENVLYCNPSTLTYSNTKDNEEDCAEDYECASNVCIDGKCTSLREELRQQRSLILQILCRIKQIFTSEDYDTCMNGGGVSGGA